MNIPNKLTLLRIILVPFFVASLLINYSTNNYNYLIALVIFCIASFTDYLDGKIAREKNLITNFGKFADPLADKILVLSAFLCFVELGLVSSVIVIIIIFREFAVTSIRLIAASDGSVVSANIWGKIKTVSQLITIIFILISQYLITSNFIGQINISLFNTFIIYTVINTLKIILLWATTIITVISGIIYIYDNKKYFINNI